MPNVNYVREHVRFIEYASDENLSAGERLLWYALMQVMNQRAQGCNWPEDFIRVPNDRLLLYCPMKLDAIYAARNALKQRGLIDFIAGDKKGRKTPQYRMNYFYPERQGNGAGRTCDTEIPYQTPYHTASDTDKPYQTPYQMACDTEIPYQTPDILGDQTPDVLGDQTPDIYINYTRGNVGVNPGKEEEEEEEEERARARARVRDAFREYFGRVIPAEADRVYQMATARGYGADVAEEAIRCAAEDGAQNPRAYIGEMLSDWQDAGVVTREDVGRLAFLRDEARGRTAFGSREAAEAELKEMRERRRT